MTAPWHPQQWVKDGRPYPDPDGGGMLQRWRCLECGKVRELWAWVKPRNYWHGRREGVRHR